MIALSHAEISAVYAAFVPGYRPDRRRYSTAYRRGDSANALSIHPERGWYDHVTGEGGDCIAFVMRAHQCNFSSAVEQVEAIIGRSLTGPKRLRRRPSNEALIRAERFRVGLVWRIDRALAEVKTRIWDEDETAIRLARELTLLRSEIEQWGAETALANMRQTDAELVRQCISEASEADELLAQAICGGVHVK